MCRSDRSGRTPGAPGGQTAGQRKPGPFRGKQSYVTQSGECPLTSWGCRSWVSSPNSGGVWCVMGQQRPPLCISATFCGCPTSFHNGLPSHWTVPRRGRRIGTQSKALNSMRKGGEVEGVEGEGFPTSGRWIGSRWGPCLVRCLFTAFVPMHKGVEKMHNQETLHIRLSALGEE